MLLHALLRQLDSGLTTDGLKGIEVRGIREDSRSVRPGDLFIARAGTKTDGRQYISDAAALGAVAVVTGERVKDCPLPQVVVKDIALAAGRLANLLHDNPSHRVKVLGVTGTNGKTTTAYLLRHVLSTAGRRCGMVGTVEIDDGRTCRAAEMTTPSVAEVAELLGQMRDRGCWSCAIEVSSHALEQGRVAGVRFAGAAFTNLTGDHLDYHKTMGNYASAKAKLFDSLEPGAVAVINAQDRWAKRIVRDCKARVITFGLGRLGDYRAKKIEISAAGSKFILDAPDGEALVEMRLIGRHNIANALTAAALLGEVCGMSVGEIAAGLRTALGAPGRLQPVGPGRPFAVFVDYAHTDDGLKNVLKALRPLTTGKLRVLFGCGGDRDRKKRPRMARVAERLADVVYVTSDNPRTEDPNKIIDGIIAGFSASAQLIGATRSTVPPGKVSSVSKPIIVEADRHQAIAKVLGDAQEGDIVLLAGKGHEDYQIIGSEKRHFSDVEEAERILRPEATATAVA